MASIPTRLPILTAIQCVFFIILVIGLFCAVEINAGGDLGESLLAKGGGSKQREFDYFKLALQWPGTFCRRTRRCCSTNGCCRGSKAPTEFTIHGLWPDYNDGTWPSCCTGKKFEAKEVSTLLGALNKYWPTLSCGSTSNCHGGKGLFWEHEWEKHGTCSSSVTGDEYNYFVTGLNVYFKYNVTILGMSTSASNVASHTPPLTPSSTIDPNRPLWQYVTKQEKTSMGGGNQNFMCNFCKVIFNGSYSRVKAHLLKISGQGIRACSKLTVGQVADMKKLEDDALQRIASSKTKMIPLPQSNSSQASSCSISMDSIGHSSFRQDSYEPKKRKTAGNTPLEKAFNLNVKEQLDGEVGRMFYSGGIPFNFARNPYFIRCIQSIAKANLPSYTPPGYNALRTKVLEKEKVHIDGLLESARSTWKVKGVSIVSDGWSDPQKRPLINFMAINERGPIFIRAVNCQGNYKDKHFIFNLIKEVIMEVGVTNVVQVITDNAPVCKAAGLLIEQTYPHIFWTPCVVHTLNLAFKNICAAKNTETNGETYYECRWISELIGSAVMIRNFIVNHSMRLAMYNEFSKLKLLSVADTRFASMIVMLRRFKVVKQQLQALVISDQWSCYREDDTTRAKLVKDRLLDDTWWGDVDYILTFTEPMYSMLRLCDTDQPCLHLVYEMWDSMIHDVKKIIYAHEMKSEGQESSFWNVVRIILEERWSKSSNPLHCLAHSLNPRCYTKEWENQHPHVASPRSDPEISRMRKNCLKRLFPSEETRQEANVELAEFLGFLGEFGDEDSIKDRSRLTPLQWWLIHGPAAPNLQSICIKLFGQVCSSSCCERNWSTYAFIHSTKRNKITPQRAEDLVFVHSNLRLLSRKTPQYAEGETRMWDVGGDTHEPLDDVGTLGVANLSLHEPELEAMLFVDEVNEDLNDDLVV